MAPPYHQDPQFDDNLEEDESSPTSSATDEPSSPHGQKLETSSETLTTTISLSSDVISGDESDSPDTPSSISSDVKKGAQGLFYLKFGQFFGGAQSQELASWMKPQNLCKTC